MSTEKSKFTFDETVLIRKIQSGQIALFGQIAERYQDRLYRLAYRLVDDSEIALEIVQETFMRAIKGIEQFHGRARFYTWLVRILINCVNSWRFKERHQHQTIENMQKLLLSSQAKGLIGDNPVTMLENKELNELLWQGLNNIEPEHKQILLLREQQGLSYDEISQVMHISEGTVKSKLFRAREKLRKTIFERLSGNSKKTEDVNDE